MGNTLETTLSPALNEITAGNHVLVSQILAATVSASIVLISLRNLHKKGFFFSKLKKPVEWKNAANSHSLNYHKILEDKPNLYFIVAAPGGHF